MSDPLDISGEWFGVYGYGPTGTHRVEFLASLATGPSGHFTGTVADAHGIGEAILQGQRSGETVHFMKTYTRTVYRQARPVDYTGRWEEDGAALRGTWSVSGRLFGLIPITTTGIWEMRRAASAIWPPAPRTDLPDESERDSDPQ